MTSPRMNGLAAPLAVLMIAGVAVAQEDPEALPQKKSSPVQWSIFGGGSGQFGDGIDGGGDVDIYRFNFNVQSRFDVTRDADLTLNFGYRLDYYDFDGMTGIGFEPWEDIHTFSFNAVLGVDLADDFRLFVGPTILTAAESADNFDDGLVAGGMVGATVRVNDSLVLGGGIGVMDKIEDNVMVFPIFIVDWEITNDFRLSTQTGATTMRAPGVELIWEPDETMEIALGASYFYHRFRLDDGGIAPDGVGEESGLPIWLRFGWKLDQNVDLNVFAGVMAIGEFWIEDTNGARIANEDYDPAGFFGVTGRIRF